MLEQDTLYEAKHECFLICKSCNNGMRVVIKCHREINNAPLKGCMVLDKGETIKCMKSEQEIWTHNRHQLALKKLNVSIT